MTCPECGSQNVNVQFVQTGARTSTKKKGCLFGLGRFILVVFTFGLWAIFGKKAAKSTTTFEQEKRATCSNCGYSWRVVGVARLNGRAV